MFAKMEIMGRLVADAQIKTTKNGDEYIDMRMVVNQYKGKDNQSEPLWVSVRSFNTPKSIAKYYTKGKPLIVEGTYEQKLYNTTDGRVGIDNSILAYRIDFVDGGQQQEQGAETAQSQKTEFQNVKINLPKKKGTEAAEAPAPQSAPQPVQTAADSADDDLPF